MATGGREAAVASADTDRRGPGAASTGPAGEGPTRRGRAAAGPAVAIVLPFVVGAVVIILSSPLIIGQPSTRAAARGLLRAVEGSLRRSYNASSRRSSWRRRSSRRAWPWASASRPACSTSARGQLLMGRWAAAASASRWRTAARSWRSRWRSWPAAGGAFWGFIPGVLKASGRPRGRHHDHAQLHRPRGRRCPAARPWPRPPRLSRTPMTDDVGNAALPILLREHGQSGS